MSCHSPSRRRGPMAPHRSETATPRYRELLHRLLRQTRGFGHVICQTESRFWHVPRHTQSLHHHAPHRGTPAPLTYATRDVPAPRAPQPLLAKECPGAHRGGRPNSRNQQRPDPDDGRPIGSSIRRRDAHSCIPALESPQTIRCSLSARYYSRSRPAPCGFGADPPDVPRPAAAPSEGDCLGRRQSRLRGRVRRPVCVRSAKRRGPW